MENHQGYHPTQEGSSPNGHEEDQRTLKRWPGLQSLVLVFRQRTEGEHQSLEVAYFISSHPPKVRALARHIRGH